VQTTRKIVSLYFFFLVLITGCSKSISATPETPVNPTSPNIDISGKWRWVESFSGWGGLNTPATDSIVTLQFSRDSTFNISINSDIKVNGTYSIWKSPFSDSLTVISFSKAYRVHKLLLFRNESIGYLTKDSMTIRDWQIADGYSHIFYRLP
jgi:hypothetical protein